ncbi:SDR family NAD(P)-dependent oxidoreductase, partial [Streptomyces sp. NPDC058307]|uniref:SDR family NAD(P)-dependent oxidoreductase n=1 Tax=Streptomyces sp. NPDC058307 TaxID=3346439 RepID=UPI0036E98CFF
NEGGSRRFLTSLAELWTHGVTPDWTAVLPGTATTPVDLPTYAFQRDHYWLAPAGPDRAAPPDAHADFWAAVEREDPEELARTLGLDGAGGELTAVLPALSAWHRRRSSAIELNSWQYRESWAPLPDNAPTGLSGTWLVAVVPGQADGGLHQATVEGLRGHGAVVETIVAPEDPRRWADLLDEWPSAVGVLSLLAVDTMSASDPAALHRTLQLIQGMAAANLAASLWCVTQGAVSVAAYDPLTRPEQAAVWGLGRVVAQELPTQWGGLVDLPMEPDRRTMSRLCAVLASDAHEDQVAVRRTGILGRRIVRAPLGDVPQGDGRRPGSGTTLITGGTGALGSRLARRLAAQGAEHLLLVSRRGDSAPGAADLVAELTRTGTRVTLAACDVSDDDALRELLAAIPAESPLTSVFHTAAVLDDAAVESLTPEQVDAVLRVKAGAAWRLHELTLGLELSAFVLFSSVAGSVGMAGQGNYAPANAYVDALARYRRAQGLTATSVAWGPWAQGGMADGNSVAELRIRHGLPLLPPESAVLALEAVLEQGETAAVVADVDWERFAHAYTAVRPSRLLDEIPEARQALGGAGAGARAGDDTEDRWADAGTDPRERRRRLLEAVRTQVAAVLGHDSADPVSTKRPFRELGLDSVTAVELRNRLTGVTGIRLPATVIFDHPTVTELVDHLGAQLFDEGDEPETPGAADLERLDGLLTTMPDDDPARAAIADGLRRLLKLAVGADRPAETAVDAEELEASTNGELLAFIEKEFGIS